MNLKKIIAALLSCALTCGTVCAAENLSRSSASAEAQGTEDSGALENPCNKQDDKEVRYDGSRWIQPEDWNTPTINPKDYEGGIMFYIDKIGLEPSYAPFKTQRIYFSITGAETPVNYIKFHIFYDTRLTVKNNTKGEPATAGKGTTGFTTGSAMVKEGQLAFYAYSDEAVQIPHSCLFTIDFTLPENAEQGEMYPIGISYVDDGIVSDCFINSEKDEAGKLQMTYLFTKGIYNGYIKILGEKKTTAAPPSAEPLLGDVNCDGTVSAADAVLLSRIAAEDPCADIPLTEKSFPAADYDKDNLITILDARKLLSDLLGAKTG